MAPGIPPKRRRISDLLGRFLRRARQVTLRSPVRHAAQHIVQIASERSSGEDSRRRAASQWLKCRKCACQHTSLRSVPDDWPVSPGHAQRQQRGVTPRLLPAAPAVRTIETAAAIPITPAVPMLTSQRTASSRSAQRQLVVAALHAVVDNDPGFLSEPLNASCLHSAARCRSRVSRVARTKSGGRCRH